MARISGQSKGASVNPTGSASGVFEEKTPGEITPKTENANLDLSGGKCTADEFEGSLDTPGTASYRDSEGVLQELINSEGPNKSKGVWSYVYSDVLDNDSEIAINSGKSGKGYVIAGDAQEYVTFYYTGTSVILTADKSANVANSDSDGDLCVYYSGSPGNLAIKNRLGSPLKIQYRIDGS